MEQQDAQHRVRLGTSGPGVPTVRDWGVNVRGQLETDLLGLENIVLIALAGSQYRTAPQGVPWPVEVPAQGLAIGWQLAWPTMELAR